MIYLLNAHHSGSHAAWASGLARQFSDELRLFTLPGRHWKWRMHGAAVHFADLLNEEPAPSMILVTDMIDLATFRGLYRHRVPTLLYYHENQLTYPWSERDSDTNLGRDRHYGWINMTSALAADGVAFNSEYHRVALLEAIPPFLKALPDFRPKQLVERIRAKSTVLPIGFDFPDTLIETDAKPEVPVLLWNHRWEYDKGPDDFLQLCRELKKIRLDFKLIVLGESGREHPPAFDAIHQEFQNRLIHYGFAADRTQYWSLLSRATVQPVTSRQDFFGMSIVEAQRAGVIPLLPNRLVFPERAASLPLLYDSMEELVNLIVDPPDISATHIQSIAQSYRWSEVIDYYREWFRGYGF
ncbi:MAG: DUF3524 domain-containing protein [Bacteroidota bacterium]